MAVTLREMDDLRVGRTGRALRQRAHLRQADVAGRAGLSQALVSLVERGRIDGVTIRALRAVFAALEAQVVISIRWRGGELDRLLDARHAALAAIVTERLEGFGWTVVPEVSYAIFGERGSIDLLAWHADTQSLLVIELKTELTSVEETLRRHDAKVRLAARIARERFGWRAASVSRLLAFPDQRTVRRHVAQHALLIRRAYPLGTVAIRRWLASPAGVSSGLAFVPPTTGSRGMRDLTARRRVRRVTPRSGGGNSYARTRGNVA